MRKNSLASKGLSLSQAQSISNLCFQRASQIDSKLKSVNNISRTVVIDGKDYVETVAQPLPSPFTVVTMLTEKAKLHATQAFLMENIKAKEDMLNEIRRSHTSFDLPQPQCENAPRPDMLSNVDEDWGWEQLTTSEVNEFIEAEAFAAHIHQFINKNGKLTTLRNELPTIKTLEWFELAAGHKTPVTVNIHHDSDDLLALHEELASLHRTYEQRVNYFKSKIKNLVTVENARIAKLNSDMQSEYNTAQAVLNAVHEKAFHEWNSARTEAITAWEVFKQEQIKTIAAYRIQVDARFQDVVDTFLVEDTDN